jgi:hypothetical protein
VVTVKYSSRIFTTDSVKTKRHRASWKSEILIRDRTAQFFFLSSHRERKKNSLALELDFSFIALLPGGRMITRARAQGAKK